MHIIRPVSLMDKTMDSGSIDMGSIPIRDASSEYRLNIVCALLLYPWEFL